MSEQESVLKETVANLHATQVEKQLNDIGWEGTKRILDTNDLRIATQARELVVQGVTLRNTFKEFNEVWLSLHTEDKKNIIVEQTATRLKYQLVNLYAVKLIKYINSIVGLDMVPLAQQDPTTRTWKMDAVILNIASNKVTDHEHLFRLMMVNLFGVSEDVIDFSLAPTYTKLSAYLGKTYGKEIPGVVHNGEPSIEEMDKVVIDFITTGKLFVG